MRLGLKLLPFTVGVGVALLATEVLIRQYFRMDLVYEPGVGYVEGPGTAVWRREGNGVSHWSDHGLRRRRPPDPGRPRVLVLGDSFTEAMMTDDDDVYAARAERLLFDIGIQLLNLGRSTCSAADYVAVAAHYKDLFQPAWSVIELGSEDLGGDAWKAGRSRFLRGADGELRVDVVVPPQRRGLAGIQWELKQRSMLVGYAAVRIAEFKAAAGREPPLFRAGSMSAPPNPSSSAEERGYPVEEEMALLVRAYAGRLTFLFLSEFDPASPTTIESSIEQRWRAYCAQNELSCVSTRPGYPALAAAGRAPFGFPNTTFNTGHMNELGHAIAGRELAAELRRLHEDAVF